MKFLFTGSRKLGLESTTQPIAIEKKILGKLCVPVENYYKDDRELHNRENT